MGFGAPFREWLRGPFGDYARDRLLRPGLELFDRERVRELLDAHAAERWDASLHLWTLLNMTLWHDHWMLGRSP
jgi:asparagine synthase (glutamine-hydrolysing)